MAHRRMWCAGSLTVMWQRYSPARTLSSSPRPNNNGPTHGPGTGSGTDRHHESGRVELGRILRESVRALDDHPHARRARPDRVLNSRRSVGGPVGVHSGEGGARGPGTTGSRRRTRLLDQADGEMGVWVRLVEELHLRDHSRPGDVDDGRAGTQAGALLQRSDGGEAEIATSQIALQGDPGGALG